MDTENNRQEELQNQQDVIQENKEAASTTGDNESVVAPPLTPQDAVAEASAEQSGEAELNEETGTEPAGEENSEEPSVHTEASAEEQDESKPGALAANTNPNLGWFVVHAYSGYEEKAKSALVERIQSGGLEAKFGEIVIPTSTTETTTKKGKKRQVTKTQFPGYMIVQMEMDETTMTVVKNTPRITGFVGNQRNPRPLPDHEVMKLISPEEAPAAEQVVEREVLFEKGEGVKVIDGPFSNFDGIVDEVRPDKARLRVLVSIFGRETPVELEYRQVEKLN